MSKIRQRYNTAYLFTLLLLVLSLFIASTRITYAASAGTGEISGQILNATNKNAPVANQSVTLQMSQNNSTRDLITITTDAQGRYSFSALESDSSVQYAVYTLYQGAQYVTDLIDLSKKPLQKVNLVVYSSTTSTANIAIVQTTLLINKPDTQAGMISIDEDFFFENLGPTTYVGSLTASQSKPDALLFNLPADARFLALGTGFGGYKSVQVDDGFASDAAIVPGTSRFSFSFRVPYHGTSYRFSYQAIYPTVELSLLTPLSILTTPHGLSSQGPYNTQTGTFQLFKGETLGAGKTVQAQLTGLPPQTEAASSTNPLNTGAIWLAGILILLMILLGIGGYLYKTRRFRAASAQKKGNTIRSMQASTKKGAATTKDALLRELLALDKAHEAGKIKKGTYQAQRAETKARLRTLMKEQSENETSVESKAGAASSKGKK